VSDTRGFFYVWMIRLQGCDHAWIGGNEIRLFSAVVRPNHGFETNRDPVYWSQRLQFHRPTQIQIQQPHLKPRKPWEVSWQTDRRSSLHQAAIARRRTSPRHRYCICASRSADVRFANRTVILLRLHSEVIREVQVRGSCFGLFGTHAFGVKILCDYCA